MTIQEILLKGGPVVWILLGYSVIAVAIVLERILYFGLIGRPPKALEAGLHGARSEHDIARLIEPVKGPEGELMRGLVAASREGICDLGRVASRLGSVRLRDMERGFRTLSILGNTAPLLGLFGTIVGMIKAFMVIEEAGGKVDAQALAGGIWEAMLTTGVGLMVAIPVLLLLHFLEGMADRRAHSMKRFASLLVERLPHTPDTDPVTEESQPKEVAHAF